MGEFPQRFGKYTLLRRVAVGGMAEVLLAVERTEHAGYRFVTIKRIKPEFIADADYIEFFLTEGRVSLKCIHPNLPQTFDMGVENGLHYLAMEYLQGHTLLDIIRAAALQARPLSVATALRVAVGVAAALEHAHGLVDVDGKPLGVIHRDVTPQNIMVTASGAVKLIDFGIVRAAVQTHHTQAGVVKGKFSYMAPEMLHGLPSQIDHRADLFALGIVLYETLTGRSLFRGRSEEETLHRVRSLPIPDLTQLRGDVPRAFADLIVHLLERNPDARFQSATDVMHALDHAAEVGQIFASVTRLREEVLDRCGVPPAPSLDAEARAMLELGPPVGDRPTEDMPALRPGDEVIPVNLEDVVWEANSVTDHGVEVMAGGSPAGRDSARATADYRAPTTTDEAEAEADPGFASDERLRYLDRDPELLYYLRKAGALAGLAVSASTTHADRELSELLANLDER